MSAPEVTVWVQPLGSGWVPVGADLGVELIPQSVTWEDVRLGGSSSASFDVRRDTRVAWSDLGPFTPVLIQLGGVDRWRGRIAATPKKTGSERVWSVQCEGMYAHLNDDLTNKVFVHDGSSGWVDARTMPDQDNAVWAGWNGEVTNTEFGKIMLRVPQATVVPASANLGVFLDAGPGNVIESIYIDWASTANDASADLLLGSSADGTGAFDESQIVSALNVASGTYTKTWNTPRRYAAISYSRSASTTYGGNLHVVIKEVRVVVSSEYLSGGASVLTTSEVVKSDLTECCPLISGDHSLIETTSTAVPHFWPDSWATPRERLESLLAVEPYQFSVTAEPVPRAKLTAIPTTPMWVYDAGTDGGSFDDGGANDGQEMYSHAVVPYTSSLGAKADTEFSTESASISFSNGTFDVNTTGWTARSAATTMARVTSPTYGGAGALRFTAASDADTFGAYTSSFSAAFKSGRTYTITGRYRVAAHAPTTSSSQVMLWVESAADGGDEVVSQNRGRFVSVQETATGVWRDLSVTFVADTDAYTVHMIIASGGLFVLPAFKPDWTAGTVVGYIDELTVELHGVTLMERRGFKRTVALQSDVSNSTAATAHADAFLDVAQYPPFKGSLTLSGYARKYGTDERIPVGQIPAGDALLVYDESDPATGSVGRVGIIEKVSYTHDTLTAQLDLDSRQDLLDQIMLAQRGL